MITVICSGDDENDRKYDNGDDYDDHDDHHRTLSSPAPVTPELQPRSARTRRKRASL